MQQCLRFRFQVIRKAVSDKLDPRRFLVKVDRRHPTFIPGGGVLYPFEQIKELEFIYTDVVTSNLQGYSSLSVARRGA